MAEKLIGVIGGTGLGDALAEHLSGFERIDVDTPFGKPSSSIVIGRAGKNKIAFINRHGQGHKLSPSEIPYTANIYALKKLGVRTLLSTGAVGSLQEQITPGDLVLVDQFIDKTFKRQNTFFTGYGAVHCEFAQPTCGRLRKRLYSIAEKINVNTHVQGTYVCIEGPQFSTRAESLMHKKWGADLIGMTALPEAKLARETQMCYALVALASDYDCWREHEANKDKQTLLKEIISNLNNATQSCLKLLREVIESDDKLICDDCHCRASLELAVWTNNSQVSDDDKQKFDILFE